MAVAINDDISDDLYYLMEYVGEHYKNLDIELINFEWEMEVGNTTKISYTIEFHKISHFIKNHKHLKKIPDISKGCIYNLMLISDNGIVEPNKIIITRNCFISIDRM